MIIGPFFAHWGNRSRIRARNGPSEGLCEGEFVAMFARHASTLVSQNGDAPGDDFYQTISFDYTATASDDGKDIVLRF